MSNEIKITRAQARVYFRGLCVAAGECFAMSRIVSAADTRRSILKTANEYRRAAESLRRKLEQR